MTRGRSGRRASFYAPLAGLGAVLAVAFGVLVYISGRVPTFRGDEWEFVMNRAAWNWDSFLRPHNEHLSAIPVWWYKVLFATVGLGTYWPYRLLLALHVIAIGGLIYVLARPRLGRWLALVPVALVVVMGQASDDLNWPFQIGFDGSILAGLGVFVAFDRQSRAGDICASVLIAVSMYYSTIGLAVFVGAAVEILLRRDRWRRVWILALPAVLYGLWWAGYNVATFDGSNVTRLPHFVLDAAAGAAAALFDLTRGGLLLVAAFIAVLGVTLLRRRSVEPRVFSALAVALSFWILVGLGRAEESSPSAYRYLLPGAVFLLVAFISLVNADGWPTFVKGTAGALTIVVCAADLHTLLVRTDQAAREPRQTRIELAALQLAAASGPVDPSFRLDPSNANGDIDIEADKYFAAVRRWGSPAAPITSLARAPEPFRQAADRVFALARRVRLEAGTTADTGRCLQVFPGGSTTLRVPARGLELRADGAGGDRVAIRRWADTFSVELGTLAPRRWERLVIGRDPDPVPWRVRITGPSALRACP